MATAARAKSSGEHDTSFASPPGPVTRGRVWANADVDKTTRAKLANKARGNSFLNSIDRELPSLKYFSFGYCFVRGAPLKAFGILAAGSEWFNRQCDCFVTKRLEHQGFALKEVTNSLQVRSIWSIRKNW
jgi:hypothetical protein